MVRKVTQKDKKMTSTTQQQVEFESKVDPISVIEIDEDTLVVKEDVEEGDVLT